MIYPENYERLRHILSSFSHGPTIFVTVDIPHHDHVENQFQETCMEMLQDTIFQNGRV